MPPPSMPSACAAREDTSGPGGSGARSPTTMATPQVDDDDVQITVAAVAVASDDDGDGGHDGNEESYSGNDDVGARRGDVVPSFGASI